MPPAAYPSKTISIQCPHCGGQAKVRSSKAVTALVKDLWIACQNTMCGATYKGQLALIATISPPAVENPRIALRTASRPFAAEMIAPEAPRRLHRAPMPVPANDVGSVDGVANDNPTEAAITG